MADSKLLSRLSRVEGQVRGLAGMLREGRSCFDVVAQIRAARAGLFRVEQIVLADELKLCIEQALESSDAKDQRRKVEALIAIIGKTEG
jgi:CsoR family transcriptional regulator, copper-sensing transcriptional repressor